MIDLNKYSDKEIIEALLNTNGFKLMGVMTGISKVMDRMNTRSDTIADSVSTDKVDETVRRLFEGKE